MMSIDTLLCLAYIEAHLLCLAYRLTQSKGACYRQVDHAPQILHLLEASIYGNTPNPQPPNGAAIWAATRAVPAKPDTNGTSAKRKDAEMTHGYSARILYDDSEPDIREALLRCRDLVTFLCQRLYPGADLTGQHPDPRLSATDPPPTLLWWLSALQVTLDELHAHVSANLPDPLTTALRAYMAQHPEQASQLRQVLVEANARDFIQWDQMTAFMASSASLSDPARPLGVMTPGVTVTCDDPAPSST